MDTDIEVIELSKTVTVSEFVASQYTIGGGMVGFGTFQETGVDDAGDEWGTVGRCVLTFTSLAVDDDRQVAIGVLLHVSGFSSDYLGLKS